MINTSFNLSGKIDPYTVNVLLTVDKETGALNIPFFVVGATARDIILQHCYNMTPRRMTMDVDIGVEVADWNQFDELSNALISSGNFIATRDKHRFLFKNRAIDIIPFGLIADHDKKISWPPEHVIFMSILGFKEAYEDSITVRLNANPVLDIKIPTLPGLAIMKLISWEEKYPERRKDAEDLHFVMESYYRAGNEDRLYENYQTLIEEEEFETRAAGIRLLGRDMATIANPDTREKLQKILMHETGEQTRYRLVQDMIRGSLEDNQFDNVLNQLEKLKKGITEITNTK
jgi:predicted nucleotidyltransferase